MFEYRGLHTIIILSELFPSAYFRLSKIRGSFAVNQMADQSQTSTGLSVYVCGGLHSVRTLPTNVLLAKVFRY